MYGPDYLARHIHFSARSGFIKQLDFLPSLLIFRIILLSFRQLDVALIKQKLQANGVVAMGEGHGRPPPKL